MAARRAPVRRIVVRTVDPAIGLFSDYLECGHEMVVLQPRKVAYARRCTKCGRESLKGEEV